MSLDEDFFDKFEYQKVMYDGKEYEEPLKYFDFLRMTSYFPASAKKLKKYLPSKKLKLLKPFPGMSIIFIVAFQYRKVSYLEPYNEVGIGFPVVLKTQKKKIQGTYLIHLPLTTEEACKLGLEISGFPKFIADITFEDTEHTKICHLKHEGKDILSIECKKLDTVVRSSELNSFTVKGNKLLRTVVTSQSLSGGSREKGSALLTLGNHPIAEELKGLLLKTESVGHEYEPKAQLSLPFAEEEYDL